MTAERRAPARHVPEWHCQREMVRGDVRRHTARGRAFCYVVCCPGCGRVSSHMVDAWDLREGPLTTSSAPFGRPPAPTPFDHPEEMTSGRSCPCPGCGGALRAEGRDLVLVPPGA